MTSTTTQGLHLTRERKTDYEDTSTGVGVKKRVKSKRRRSFVEDEHANTTDVPAATNEVAAPTNLDSREPAADISAPPSSHEKDNAATDGSASRMPVLRSDHKGSSHPTPIKEKTEAAPQVSSGQGTTVSDAAKTHGSQLGSNLPDVGNATTSATPSRKSSGLTDKEPRNSEVVYTAAGARLTKFRAILTMSVTAVIVLAVVIVVFMPRRKQTAPMEPYCETDDCFQHSYRLLAKLNHSLDPCENFNAYVCSAWSPPERYLEHSNSAMDDVRKSWFPAFSDMLTLGSKTIRVGLKPLAMYSSCMANQSVYGSNVKIFWEMLKECRLNWPEEPEPHKNSALGVLITLAFKWQLPLFFQVRALRLKSTPNWRFNMDPGSLIPLMYQHHLAVKNSGGYEKYWATFYYILSAKYNESAVNKTTIATAKAIEGDVFKRLLTAMRPPVVHPVLVPISEVGPYTPSLSSAQWLRAFRETELDPEVELNDQILFGDTGFFLTLAGVMNSYKDTELLSLIAWSFVQLLSPAVDYRLLENRYEQGVTLYRPYFCERLVETAYRFLVIALHATSRFSPQERAFVTTGFDSLVSAAVDMVNASGWLDVESRKLAAAKLSWARLQLWPPERYLYNNILGNIYATFPSVEDSFAEYWAKSMRSAAETYRPRRDIDVQSYALNYALPYFLYDASSNTVKVAVGAVTAPLYYLSGTKSMFYGGLGYSMALVLVSSLDRQGLRWHPDGTFGASFLSKTSARAFEMRDSCLAAAQNGSGGSAETNKTVLERSNSVFPEIPALELAYMAYKRSVSDGSDNSPQGIPGGISGDKVFFMTLCYMMCTLPGAVGPHTVDCNKAVRNSEAFARAFRCPLGSQMNPRQKCAFFG
ncbi:hypothetical protein HPB52_001694 [Rhipicephalus sanguineus]|uniref:Uncharacterized protein n=1 Tax=Rhipicephalus sanguineus TaxID=34632 RepID=A0A9D4SXA9_RHISA|nr:hypothetical protein HPB52_001694 [Rhipicephalus sanguineus]